MPIIGEWAEDIYVSSGHGPWCVFILALVPPLPRRSHTHCRGITLAPGSGIVLAELISADLANVKPKLSADISGLDPHRFVPKRASKL